MTDKSWTEIQSLGVKAASGAAVPPAQALAFGAMVARHLSDGGSEDPLHAALNAPDTILTLAHEIEAMVEAASMSTRIVSAQQPDAGQRALLISWLASLPCQADIVTHENAVQAHLSLKAPSTRTRPARIAISPSLFSHMQDLATRTYVPDSAASRTSGAGAGLMELD
jgi:hypothetical protein